MSVLLYTRIDNLETEIDTLLKVNTSLLETLILIKQHESKKSNSDNTITTLIMEALESYE